MHLNSISPIDRTLSGATTPGQKMDQGAMAMKEYSAFPKAPALMEPHHQILSFISSTVIRGVLPLCRNAVSVSYSPNRLGNIYIYIYILVDGG